MTVKALVAQKLGMMSVVDPESGVVRPVTILRASHNFVHPG